jgi:conjugal transfer/entry exclusion protein
MKLVVFIFCLVPMVAFAQAPTTALSTDPQQIENLIQATGCRAEVTAAAQTIANLQKQINDLQKQLNAKDPPKSGATKH